MSAKSGNAVATLERWIVGAAQGAAGHLGARILHHARCIPFARFSGFTLIIPFVALVAIPLLASDLVVLNAWIFDYSLPLDTSLRWLHGQVPHRDFETPIGAAYWLVQGWSVSLLGGADARSPILANFIAVGPIILGTFVLLRPRLSGGIFGLLLLAGVLLVISPRSPGDLPGQISFLAAYNKVGLAILAVLLAGLFIEPRDIRSRAGRFGDAAVIGLFLLWLVYLKVTFAGVALMGCLAALHYAPRNRAAIVYGIVLALCGSVLIEWSTGINAAYIDDIANAAAAGGALRLGKLLVDLDSSRLTIAVSVIAALLYWRLSRADETVRRANMVIAAGLFLAGVAALNQVHDNYLALSFVPLLVLGERALRERGVSGDVAAMPSYVPPVIGAAFLVITAMLSDAISSAHYYTAGKNTEVGEHPSSLCEDPQAPACRIVYQVIDTTDAAWARPLPSPSLAPSAPVSTGLPNGSDAQSIGAMLDACDSREDCLFWKIQEQLYDLLNQYVVADDTPLFLGFSNLLPYYYQTRPPKHVPAWLDVGRNISADAHPDPARFFSDVSLLVVPKVNFKVGKINGLNEIYRDDIPLYFDLLVETESWQIWRKR